MTPGTARIAVVHSRQLHLAALVELLTAPPLEARVASFSRSDSALAAVEAQPVDLLLCGLRSEPIDGSDVVRRLRALGGCTIALIADADDTDAALEALQSGADGVFTADMSQHEFVAGIDAVLRGHYVLSATLAKHTMARRPTPEERAPALSALGLLSSTEREILLALGRATPIDAIASARGVTKKTVRNHVASIYHKLQFRSRAEAILWVARMGLGEDSTREKAQVEAASA